MAKPAVVFLGVAAGVSTAGGLALAVAWLFMGGSSPEPRAGVEAAAIAPVPDIGPTPPEPAPAEVAAADVPVEVANEPARSTAAVESVELAADAAGPVFVNLPNYSEHFAHDPQHGRLAIVGAWERAVGFLSRNELRDGVAEVTKLVNVEGTPTSVAFKPTDQGGMFVVGQQGPPALVLIDAESLSVTRTISLSGETEHGPVALTASSNAADPYVYAMLGEHSPETAARLNVLGREPPVPWNRRVSRMAAAADGNAVYAMLDDDPQGLCVVGSGLSRPDGTGDDWRIVAQATDAHEHVPVVVDGAGGWMALGRDVYFADLRRRFSQLAFRPLAFLQAPWAFGAAEKELVIASINNGEVAARFPLIGPEELSSFEGERDQMLRQWSEALLAAFVDPVAHRLIVTSGRSVATYPLPTQPLPEQPILVLDALPGDAATVAEPYSCELTTAAPDGVAELVDGPTGATIENNQLRWTPALDDVGRVEFRVKLSGGGAEHEETWSVGVFHRMLDVPFGVIGCDPDETTGDRAVVWGVDFADAPADGAIDPLTQTHLAVVDLATRQVTAQRTVPICVSQAELNATGVYVIPDTSRVPLPPSSGPPAMQVVRLSRDDLSTLGQSLIQPGNIASLADKFLVTATSDGSKRYTLPDLQAVETHPRQKKFFEGAPLNGRVADGWILDGALWDETLDKPLLLIAQLGSEVRLDSDPRIANEFWQVMRGYLLYSAAKEDHNARYTYPSWHLPFSPYIPAMLRIDDKNGRVLEQLDLYSKKVLRRTRLTSYQQDRGRDRQIRLGDGRRIWPELTGFATTRNDFLMVYSGRVLTVPIASLGEPLPTPFRIEPVQSTFTLSASRPAQVRYVAKGAKQFKLLAPQLGIDRGAELTSATGEFTLSVEERLPDLVAANAVAAREDGMLDPSPDQRIKAHIRQAKDEYQRLFGSRPSGVPVSVEVTVQANGPDLQTAGLRHNYLVIVPEAVYLKHVQASPNDGSAPAAPVVVQDSPQRAARARAARPQFKSPSAVTYSRKWREAATAADAGSMDDARREVETLNRRFEAGVAAAGSAGGLREWADASGKKIQAALVELTDANVVLTDSRGTRLTIPLERLSAEDREWAREHPVAAEAADRDARVAHCLRQLGVALGAHMARQGSMPPARLLDDRGQPLLSWRVLLLRELGYERLAAQFRYDEPWDGPHNKELISLMPAVYDTGGGDGRTALVTVAAPSSLLSSNRAMLAEDIRDPRGEVLAVVEAADKAHVAWTRPIDPGEANLAKLDQLLVSHDGAAMALFADNSIGRTPLDISAAEWKRLMTVNDGGTISAAIKRE